MKGTFFTPVRTVILVLVVILITVMTISDIYYSKLEKNYPMLELSGSTSGMITAKKSHWKHSYVAIDGRKRIMIRPNSNEAYSPKDFHKFIQKGDSLIYEEGSKKIKIVRDSKSFHFPLVE